MRMKLGLIGTCLGNHHWLNSAVFKPTKRENWSKKWIRFGEVHETKQRNVSAREPRKRLGNHLKNLPQLWASSPRTSSRRHQTQQRPREHLDVTGGRDGRSRCVRNAVPPLLLQNWSGSDNSSMEEEEKTRVRADVCACLCSDYCTPWPRHAHRRGNLRWTSSAAEGHGQVRSVSWAIAMTLRAAGEWRSRTSSLQALGAWYHHLASLPVDQRAVAEGTKTDQVQTIYQVYEYEMRIFFLKNSSNSEEW